jgi:hypothetical protein
MTLLTAAFANIGRRRVLPYFCCAVVGCGGRSSTTHDGTGGTPDAGAAGIADSQGGVADSQGGVAGSQGGTSAGQGGAAGGEAGVGALNTGGANSAHSGMGGAALAGSAGAAGTTPDSCVNVVGGGDQPWYDLAITGSQFEAGEGERMRVVVATEAGNRVGIGEVLIANGAFSLSIPAVLNVSWYVGITLYIDRDLNDACEPEEHFWGWTTRAVASDIEYEVTPTQLCSSTFGNCSPRGTMPQICTVGSGDTDPRKPLPCIQ